MTRRNWSAPWHPQHHACSNGGCIDHNGYFVPPDADDPVPGSGEWAQGADGRWHPTGPEPAAPKRPIAQPRIEESRTMVKPNAVRPQGSSRTVKRLDEAAVNSLWWQVSADVLPETDPTRLRDAEESAADVPWLVAEIERLSGDDRITVEDARAALSWWSALDNGDAAPAPDQAESNFIAWLGRIVERSESEG